MIIRFKIKEKTYKQRAKERKSAISLAAILWFGFFEIWCQSLHKAANVAPCPSGSLLIVCWIASKFGVKAILSVVTFPSPSGVSFSSFVTGVLFISI